MKRFVWATWGKWGKKCVVCVVCVCVCVRPCQLAFAPPIFYSIHVGHVTGESTLTLFCAAYFSIGSCSLPLILTRNIILLSDRAASALSSGGLRMPCARKLRKFFSLRNFLFIIARLITYLRCLDSWIFRLPSYALTMYQFVLQSIQ